MITASFEFWFLVRSQLVSRFLRESSLLNSKLILKSKNSYPKYPRNSVKTKNSKTKIYLLLDHPISYDMQSGGTCNYNWPPYFQPRVHPWNMREWHWPVRLILISGLYSGQILSSVLLEAFFRLLFFEFLRGIDFRYGVQFEIRLLTGLDKATSGGHFFSFQNHTREQIPQLVIISWKCVSYPRL